jgi:hypothetical protein
VILTLAGALHVLAQMAVNTRVNAPIYPPGTGSGSVRYSASSSIAMPSEVRHAYWKSGSLPSDFKMGYAAIGPRPQGGAIRYVDYKPTYMDKKPGPPPQPLSPSAAASMGSVRYASSSPAPSASSSRVQSSSRSAGMPQTLSAPPPAGATGTQPSAVRSPTYGTVRYTR